MRNAKDFIETMAQHIIDSVLDDDRVKESICDGCIWQRFGRNDPRSGCSGFDEQCENYHVIRDIQDAAMNAAEIIAEAV